MSSNNVTLEITPKPTICLSMIVKNESKIICRFLDTVKCIVDFACICDTGSTDNTIEVINEYLKNTNMKGKVIRKDFINFQENRNYALAEAKKYGDYILLLDADMKLMHADKLDKSKLGDKGYLFLQKSGSLSYFNLRLVPSNINSKYIGVTHEYLAFDGQQEKLNIPYIDDLGDGGCKNDKFTRDEALLKKGLYDDPNNSRYMFYLGNTLRDLKKYEEAIKYYKQRIDAGGWEEEIFYSKYQIGLCYERLNQIAEMEKAYMDAWVYRPTRAEPLYDLSKYFRLNGNNVKSWAYSKIGKSIEISKDILFVNTNKYGVAFDREVSIVSYYVPPASKKMKLFKRIFNEDTTKLDLNNFIFYRKCFVPDKIIDFTFNQIYDFSDINYNSSTPCIIANNDGYEMIIRMVSYTITKNGDYICNNNSNVVSSIYTHLTLSKDFCKKNEADQIYVPDLQGSPEHWGGKKLHGIEDMKIFKKNGIMNTIGNTCRPEGKIGIVTGYLTNDSKYTNLDMIDDKCEKNWCVVPNNDNSLVLVYKWQPLTIIEADLTTGKITKTRETKMPSIFSNVRGSTDGCIFKDRIYFLGHIVQYTKPRTYSHICVEFDLKMNFIGCSYPFKLSDLSVEYCLGMIVEDKRLIFSYSENDSTSKIAVINKERFFKDHWMH